MTWTYHIDIEPHVEIRQRISNTFGHKAQDKQVITQRGKDKATKQQANTRDDSLTYCDAHTDAYILWVND